MNAFNKFFLVFHRSDLKTRRRERSREPNVETKNRENDSGPDQCEPSGSCQERTSRSKRRSSRDIRDPEHPYSLEQLSVLSEESITVDEKLGRILITFTPTIQHCSMAAVIGLCLRVKLKECFPPHFKVDIKVAPGSHADEESGEVGKIVYRISGLPDLILKMFRLVFSSVNKQLNDKERVAAALENPNLRQLVDECLYSNEL
ncbi:MIP18 family-like - like 1 [Theobroma cacao]|nr:MIP18 family-like - like 1 [Theobroma cacao]